MDAQLQAAVRDRSTLASNLGPHDTQEKAAEEHGTGAGNAPAIDPFDTGKAKKQDKVTL